MTPIYETLPASSVVTSFSATAANPANNGIQFGNLISSFLNNGTLNLSNLLVGQEYFYSLLGVGAGAFALASASVTGLTLKSTLQTDNISPTGFTYTATNSVAQLVPVVTGTTPASMISIFAQLPVTAI
jgi:hypothetical protein